MLLFKGSIVVVLVYYTTSMRHMAIQYKELQQDRVGLNYTKV